MTTTRNTAYSLGLLLLGAIGCGSGDDDSSPNHPPTMTGGSAGTSTNGGSGGNSADGGVGDTSDGSGGTTGGTTGGSTASGGKGGSSGKGGKGGSSGSGGSTAGKGGSSGAAGVAGLPVVAGEPCDSVKSALPSKPCLVNVSVKVNGDAADIHFDPVDGAVDYRVYELPADGDVSVNGDVVTVKNAVYRCAGNRMTPLVAMDAQPQYPGGAVTTLVDGQNVGGYTRSLDEATLGYVSPIPGDGLVPVYALGDSDKDADDSCFWGRWNESRAKEYVATDDDRNQLLGQAFRDDGIVFYVPASGASGTQQIYTSTDSGARYYFTDGPEASKRTGSSPAFMVYSNAADGLVPLQRVFYGNGCGHSHDELVAGMARFARARQQGATLPLNALHWSGTGTETTLVVEALADGCPKTPGGMLAPIAAPQETNDLQTVPPWVTLDDVQAASPSGEVYINGQFDESNQPRPIARSFVKVKPAPAPDFDWFQGFDDPNALGTMTDEACGAPINCLDEWRQSSDIGDVHFFSAEEDRHVIKPMFGELWLAYADVASDTPGKFRLTANTKATIADDSFLYVTMEVNAFTTTRRYPQIIISDQDVPVQWNLVNGNNVIIQTFGDWPPVYEVEVCDHRTWDVNNQCPRVDLYNYYQSGSTTQVQSLAPNAEVGEHTALDRNTQFEVWISSKRAYLYLDGEAYGCVDLPATGAPGAGPATVTFGDTLYHSGADALDRYQYVSDTFHSYTRRQFDNLGFKSGVAAPDWDESRLPCVSHLYDD